MRLRDHIGFLTGVSVLVGVLATSSRSDTPPTFQEIEESLTCQCGCGLTVSSCNHLQCGSAIPLRAEIRDQLSHGNDKAAVLAHFTNKYGEKILSAPTTVGFNLVAWIMPFALVGTGGVVIAIALVRWSARRPTIVRPVESGTDLPRAGAGDYEKILERELKEFES